MSGIGLIGLVVLVVVLGGLIGGAVLAGWLLWPRVKRRPLLSLGAILVVILLTGLWVTTLFGTRGRRVTIENESTIAYAVVMTQGGEETKLGTFRTGDRKTLRVNPDRGPLQIVYTAEGKAYPACSVGFSLQGPKILPMAARIRMKANGSFENVVGPVIFAF